MDIGTEVTCGKCLQKFLMYQDTHGTKIQPYLTGMCPKCNSSVGVKLDRYNIIVYPPNEFCFTDKLVNSIPYRGEMR